MSETNILNPTAASLFNPDYSIPITMPDIKASWQARSGRVYSRNMLARGRVFELHWDKADFTTYRTLRQWAAQYETDFFSYFDIEDNRYYSGQFAQGSFKSERVGNNQVNVMAVFVEIPGLAMNSYPTNWGVDSIFVEESDGFGGQLVKLTGAWVAENIAAAHGGKGYVSATTNDTAEWIYFGYGFRWWSLTSNNGGIAEVSLDGAVLTTVDTYTAALQNAAALYANANVSLGEHRVKIRVTGTKNAASTNFFVRADAIEVMR